MKSLIHSLLFILVISLFLSCSSTTVRDMDKKPVIDVVPGEIVDIARFGRRPARIGRPPGPGDPCWVFLLPGCRNRRVHGRCVGPS